MSELFATSNWSNNRRRLLASASALTLVMLLPVSALAEDGSHPTVWIELGGQLERLSGGQESFSPPFAAQLLENPFTPQSKLQAPPRYATSEEGRLSLSPDGSDWVVSVGVRYGRANRSVNKHEQTSPASPQRIISVPNLNIGTTKYLAPAAMRFATTASQTHTSHLLLDFQAGKDVNLGLFGQHGSSVIDGGIRFAQFTSRSTTRIDSDPDFAVTYKYLTQTRGFSGYFKIPHQSWDLYSAKNVVSRRFTGLGPSLEWDSDATLIGNPEVGALTFDWGLNGALLFGRQKMQSHHETVAHHGTAVQTQGPIATLYPTMGHDVARSRTIIVPNVGGFAGLSVRYPGAKISLGYRVDAFFGAVDGGIDTRKTYDRNFYGPFANISIGLGG